MLPMGNMVRMTTQIIYNEHKEHAGPTSMAILLSKKYGLSDIVFSKMYYHRRVCGMSK